MLFKVVLLTFAASIAAEPHKSASNIKTYYLDPQGHQWKTNHRDAITAMRNNLLHKKTHLTTLAQATEVVNDGLRWTTAQGFKDELEASSKLIDEVMKNRVFNVKVIMKYFNDLSELLRQTLEIMNANPDYFADDNPSKSDNEAVRYYYVQERDAIARSLELIKNNMVHKGINGYIEDMVKIDEEVFAELHDDD